MQRTQWIAALVLVVVLSGLLLARFGASGSSADAGSAPAGSTSPSETVAAPAPAPEPLVEPERLGPAGELVNLDGWLQTDATSLDDFDGQVRIVQFWTFSCHNCTATIPHLQEIYAAHEPNGLEIIGVHAPEFEREKDPAAIAEAAERLGVTWPIALDTNKINFRNWQPGRRFWPRTFVIDQAGEIRFDHIGEGRYDDLEATVAYLVEHGP